MIFFQTQIDIKFCAFQLLNINLKCLQFLRVYKKLSVIEPERMIILNMKDTLRKKPTYMNGIGLGF